MTPKSFHKMAGELFDVELGPAGFSRARSKHCTYYRTTDGGLYHVIMPDLCDRGAWYDIKVFPTSPVLQPLFEESFPDGLEVTTDRWSYLSEQGIGMTQGTFNCKNEANLRRRFSKTVAPLLKTVVLPYLDSLRTVEDAIPLFKDGGFRGCALHSIGRRREARPFLEQERERLLQLNSRAPIVLAWIERLNQLLTG